MKSVVKIMLIVIGTICVILGIAGIFLPLLPTTPFLLLAAFCYSRSSARFYHWLITNRWFGEYIRNYREGRGMPLKQKVIALSLLWLTMSYSIWFVVSQWWVQLIFAGYCGERYDPSGPDENIPARTSGSRITSRVFLIERS